MKNRIISAFLALVMMACTFVGAFSHLIFLKPISQMCFMITGIIGEFLHNVAEKIGMAEWSTISLSHKYYEYFFIVAIICIVIIFVAERFKIHLAKHVTVILSTIFVVLTIYCTSYDYNTPTVEVIGTDNSSIVTVNYKGETVLIGTPEKKYMDDVKDVLHMHNKKQIDMLMVTEEESETISQIIGVYENFGRAKTCFYYEFPNVFDEISACNARGFSMSGNVLAEFKANDYLKIKARDKSVVIAECKNVFENTEDCDIIIVYGKNVSEYEYHNEIGNDTQLIILNENEKVTVSF